MNSKTVKNRGLHNSVSAAAISIALLQGCSTGSNNNGNDNKIYSPEYTHISALGGDTTNTTGNHSSTGFDTPASNLEGAALAMHLEGDAQFEVKFTRAPSESFPEQDGVGPVFNNDACIECHTRDGRGNFTNEALTAAPEEWTKLGSNEAIFLRISIGPDEGSCSPEFSNQYCKPEMVSNFSTQLFHRGLLGLRESGSDFSGQADVYVQFETSLVTYADGATQTLYKPVFEIRNPFDSSGEKPGDNDPPLSTLLQPEVKTSPRMGMPMFGLGLLEAISEADILALVDEDDSNSDGISGRPNWVMDPVKAINGDPDPKSLGRFGWKAGTPSVLVQSTGAYRGDMGVTNYLATDESILNTTLHDTHLADHPDDFGQNGNEVSEDIAKAVVFYSNTLAVPARRNIDNAEVIRGAKLFDDANCSSCHHPGFTTGTHPGIWGPSGIVEVAEVGDQKIYPFTDMLLHDMGPSLADNRTEFSANGREWKTRPLWGIGLTHTVNPLAGFLHDGRARTLQEAILWHGGEAEDSKETFRTMNESDRNALVSFLNSL